MTIASLRILTVACVVALVGLSATEYRTWGRESELALASLSEAHLRNDFEQLFTDVRRERDPIRIRLRVARALLAAELDTGFLATIPPEDRESTRARGLERLDTAARLAGRTLETRPSSWQAAMILGAANHLHLLRSRDGGLATQEDSWLLPLELSRRLAPNHAEPTRFLAAAELGSWSRLSSIRRQHTIEVLATAFRDVTSFEALIEPWLVIAPSFKDALRIIPPFPHAWNKVQRIYAQRRDWERYVTAHRLYSTALVEDLGLRLDEAESALKQGNERIVAMQLKNVARNMPLEIRSLEHLDRLLDLIARTSPALHPRGDHFSKWLEWHFEQCLLGGCQELTPSISRLASASNDLEFHQIAAAARLTGDTDLAELYESRSVETTGEAWAPYQLLTASRLMAAGDLIEARTHIAAVHDAWRSSPFYALANLSLALASRDAAAQTVWKQRITDLAQPIRPGSEWRRSGTSWQLALMSGSDYGSLEIAIDQASPAGAPIAVLLDGRIIDWFSVTRNDIITLESEITKGVHRLELVPLLSHSLTPGPVRLGGGSPA